jgi:hypothetical protein
MVSIMSLWLPVLLSAVFVFIVSSIIHMVLKYHNSDFSQIPKEAEVMDALRPFDIKPGNYSVPRAADMKEMSSPGYQEKLKNGPVFMMTVMPNGPIKMGTALFQWFMFSIIVSILSGYVAGIALGPGAHYMEIFRYVSTVAFVGYTLALWQHKIWYYHSTSATIKSTFDGLIYAFVTAGTFGWLWPSI